LLTSLRATSLTHLKTQTNAFLQHASPWDLASTATDTSLIRDRDTTVFLCAEAIRLSAIMLQPYMPSSTRRLLDMLGVNPARRSLRFAEFAADDSYGEAAAGVDLGKGHVGTLFPPLATSA